jgi:molybdopterin-guanine dinucleotide biosynthesis protein MobB
MTQKHFGEHQSQSFQFHPFEMAFCGYSHSGKTTLITRLVQEMSGEYKIGYIKHDIHSFLMDHAGKDTFRVRSGGAQTAFISDARHWACLRSGHCNFIIHRQLFLENDFVFVEGYKRSDIPKLVLVDDKAEILKSGKEKPLTHALGYIADKRHRRKIPRGKICFDHGDIHGIQQFILSCFRETAEKIPLYGLVLAGGKSTRMKKDKSLLEYHGKKQSVHCFEILSKFCDQVFLSNREGQAQLDGHKTLPQIHDTFLEIGPLGGILTAMTKSPEAAWLVLACDLPFVNEKVLKTLVQRRNPFKMATAYQSVEDHGLPEPLCAIYEPKAVFGLMQSLGGGGIHCPRTILKNSDVHLLTQPQKTSLDNINTPQEYRDAVGLIKKLQLFRSFHAKAGIHRRER